MVSNSQFFMSSEVLSLERVERACRAFKPAVKDMASAEVFLEELDLNKCHATRYIAWMLMLDGLPPNPELWPKTFYYLVRSYRGKLAYYPMNKSSIPVCLDEESTKAISSDVRRANVMFSSFAREMGIPQELCEDAETRVIRLTVILFREAPQYHYLQGYDRFALISYAVSLSFVIKIGLSYIEAEALAISLLRRLIRLSDSDKYLASSSQTIEHFANVDAFLRVYNADIMDIVSRRGNASATFASNWAGVLFAESHTPLEVLLVWDQLVLHHKESFSYFKALTSAHLKQIPKAQDEFGQLELIQTFRKWDIVKLLLDAARLYKSASYGEPQLPKYSLLGLASWL